MSYLESKAICNGVTFHSINDNRFKTGRISFTAFFPLCNENAAQNAILPFLLSRSCKKFPDFTKLNQHLSKLYGANINARVNKIGEAQAITISVIGLDDKYALDSEKDIFLKLSNLLCNMIFYPNVENCCFRDDVISQEIQQLIELIDSEYSDKRIFAKNRCIQLMCKDEKFSVDRYGSREKVKELSSKEMYHALDNMLKTAKIELMAIGSFEKDTVYKEFKKAFSKIDRSKFVEPKTQVIKSATKVSEYTDRLDVAQSKLVMGFRLPIASPNKDIIAASIMVSLLGGTPHSKLFLNVREKLSLCYYCSSRFDKNKGIMIIESGVEKENIEKARKEILNQLELIKSGDFTEEELTNIKLSESNKIMGILDSIGALESFYISQMFDEKMLTAKEVVARINKVSKEKIIDIAKSISLDTVYVLTSNEKN